ncbi:hypothetical protein [Sorangium sp. So ce1000]|uniref:hypothetical protein n=1 Tax=Sorangium sp. So ce1000 TaxID=3133325 RepID=UPI003F607A6F
MTTTRRRPVRVAPLFAKLLLPIPLIALCATPARAQTPASAPLTPSSSSTSPPRASPATVESPAPPPSQSPPPWYQGVSEDRKQTAQALFEEARRLHRRMMFAEARAKYEEALAFWEHPELRLYLARVLRSIGLPVLAYENLRLSLRWGPGSLDADKEEEARSTLQALAERELATIQIRCDEPGATVLMDGKTWFVGPGAERRMVTPGEHVITARKDGYATVVKPVVVLAGKEASGQLALNAYPVVTTQRWPVWIPWATVGAGVAITVLGGTMMGQADTNHREAQRRYEESCGRTCAPFRRDPYEASVVESRLAAGTLITGAAMAVTGTVMLLVNTPPSYRTKDHSGVRIELRPTASPDAAMMRVRFVL